MTQRNPEREAAFDFGRKLVEPDFRKILADHGYTGGVQDVVVVHDDTTVGDVLDRIFTRCRPPAMVAIRRPTEPHGFALIVVEPSAESDALSGRSVHRATAPLSERTSIGMLYDSMLHTHGTTFRIGDHRSYEVQRVDQPGELADA